MAAFRNHFKNFNKHIIRYAREVDLLLIAATVAVASISILNIYGIAGFGGPFFSKQVLLVAIGLAVMVAVSFFDYRMLKNYSFPVMALYCATIGLLMFSLAFHSIRGSRAWIVLGGLTLEPSEVMKLAFIAVMAKYFSQRHIHINQFRHVLVSGIYFAIPALMILAQPDLGSTVLLAIVWGGMLLVAGINKRHLFILGTVAVIGAYLAWVFALKPFQQQRLAAFVDPYRDPTGIGYNIIQSKIAIGSGGWLGVGLGKGTQATFGFLPESHNDFAFAAWAEQFGWTGVAVLMGLIGLIVGRILAIGRRAQHNFGKLFCVGVATLIATHTTVNAAVNIGLLPITGIPFSFLSYGGSHLMAVMAALGVVQSIKRNG